MDSKFGGGVAGGNVVVVVEAVDGGDFTANVVLVELIVEGFNCWMLGVTTEYFFGFFLSILRQEGSGCWICLD